MPKRKINQSKEIQNGCMESVCVCVCVCVRDLREVSSEIFQRKVNLNRDLEKVRK